MRHKKHLLGQRPQLSEKYDLDHRISWAFALSEIAQSFPWADQPVRAYLAWIDGTGSVERGLGTHAAVLGSHVGTSAQTHDNYNATNYRD